jgi:hypothetical protein
MRLRQSTPWPAFAGGPEPERTKIESWCSQPHGLPCSVNDAVNVLLGSTCAYLNGGPVLTCAALPGWRWLSGRPQATDLAVGVRVPRGAPRHRRSAGISLLTHARPDHLWTDRAIPANRVRIACAWLLDAVLDRQAVQLGLVPAAAVPLGVDSPNPRQGSIPSWTLEVGGSPFASLQDQPTGGLRWHQEGTMRRQATVKRRPGRPGWAAAGTGLLDEPNSTDVTRRETMTPHVGGTTLGAAWTSGRAQGDPRGREVRPRSSSAGR